MVNRANSSSLRSQILRRSLLVGLAPLALLAVVAVTGLRDLNRTADEAVAQSRQTLTEETVTARLHSEAEAISREIDLVLTERINDVITWARQPALIDGAAFGADIAGQNGLVGLTADQAEQQFGAVGSLRSAPPADALLSTELQRLPQFADVLFTDRNGYVVGGLGFDDDFVQSDEAWWQQAWEHGLHLGVLAPQPQTGEYVIGVAARIENDRGEPMGVALASLRIGFVQDLADARSSSGLDVTVITGGDRLVAETSTGHDPTRIGSTDPALDRYPAGVEAALDQGSGSMIAEQAIYGFSSIPSAGSSLTGADPEAGDGIGVDWLIIAGQQRDVAVGPLAGLDELNREFNDASQRLSIVVMVVLAVATVGAMGMAIVMSKQIVVPIDRLAHSVRRAADEGLPEAVNAMRNPEVTIDSLDESMVEFTDDNELSELADSFNSVQRTAIRLALEQAKHRRGTAEMFANLGRRNQSLVKRQISLIDELEQSEEDADRLGSLFRLDHLATRMRRNAESLLVIAGDRSPVRRAAPARVEMVVQGALGEVEGYERVGTASIEPMAIAGRAAGDVAHILAELIENALAFSPPETEVAVAGQVQIDGYSVTVADHGIGMSEAELTRANDQLAGAIDLDVANTKQLGLIVVSKLAARYDISVQLSSSPGGGVEARMTIPTAVVEPATVAEVVTPARPDRTPAVGEHGTEPAERPGVDAPGLQRRSDDTEDAPPQVTPARALVSGQTSGVTSAPDPAPIPTTPPSSTSQAQINDVPRRASRRPTDPATSPAHGPAAEAAAVSAKRAVAVADSADLVHAEAEQTRDRWSSFQRGRRTANDGTTPVENEEQPDVGH